MKRKKTLILDQRLIDDVRRVYKTKTETEAITRALENAVFQEQVVKALRATAGKSPQFEKVF
jgi:hypothetical protein